MGLTDSHQEALYIVYFIFAGLSIIGSISVFLMILRYGRPKNCFTYLLLWFHVSMIGQEFALLPFVYDTNRGACIAMEFLHYYFGLMNITTLLLLVEAHRSSLLSDPYNSRKKIMQYGLFPIVGFPFITAFPFASDSYSISYSDDAIGWCILPVTGDTAWTLGIYYCWIWLFLVAAIVMACYTAIKIYQSDELLARRYTSTIGLIVKIAIVSWIPRSIERLTQYTLSDLSVTLFISYIPINISGILYSLVFLRECKDLLRFEEDDLSTRGSITSFTWEQEDIERDAQSLTMNPFLQSAHESPFVSVDHSVEKKSTF